MTSMNVIFSYKRFILALALLALSACAIQLAPPYDKVVTDGLTQTTPEAMTLLASVSHGSEAATFSTREGKYNSLIGKFEALAIQAGSRPVPKNRVSDTINHALDKRSVEILSDDDFTPSSANAIKGIAKTFIDMRDIDRKQGVAVWQASFFKIQIAAYLDQATTYENFLQR